MKVEYMKEFLAVAKEQSISVAAQHLYLAQPVLSKHIRIIEDMLHSQLFFRSTRGITLTPQGCKAFETFKKIVAEYDALAESIGVDETELCGQIRLGILTMGFDNYISPIVRGFHEIHPNVSFSYSTRQPQDMVSGLMNGSLDVAFSGSMNLKQDDNISLSCIGHDRIHLAVSAKGSLVGKEKLTPQDLKGHPLVCLTHPETTDALNKILDKAGYLNTFLAPVEEIEIVSAKIIENDGYFAIPDFMTNVFSTLQDIVLTDPADEIILPVYLMCRSTVKSPLVKTFLEWVETKTQEDRC